MRDAIKVKIANELGVSVSAITLTVAAASVRLAVTVALASAEQARSAASTLSAQMASTSAASSFLSTSSLAITVVTIAAAPSVVENSATTTNANSQPPPPAAPDATPPLGSTPPPPVPAASSGITCLTHPCWMASQPPTSTLKILALHGGDGSGSGDDFRGLTSSFPSGVTVVHPNGGYPSGGSGSFLWVPDPPGGKNQATTNRDVADASVSALNDIIARQGPFDGIMGFSQGSMMVLYYLARVPVGTFRFALMFCGYVPTTHLGMVAYIDAAAPITTPAFVFAGSSDAIITGSMTEGQRDKFASTSRTYHVGSGVGHSVPRAGDDGYSQATAFINQYRG